MTVLYPVYLIPDEPGYIVEVPDIDAATEGYDMLEAIAMARDLIGTMCIDMEDEGKEIPEAESKEYTPQDGTIKTYVDVDLAEYRRKTDNKMVKKNCTIPSWMSWEAEQRGINCSRVLRDALQEKLNISM